MAVTKERKLEIAADALRLSSLLLDSPMPPDLARQYAEISPD